MNNTMVSAPISRPVHILLWVVQVLLACTFIAAGSFKLAAAAQMVELFDKIGIGQWFRMLTGGVEVVAGLALLVPAAAPFAGVVLGVTMACAVGVHLLVIGGSPLPAITLGILSAFVAYMRWPRH
jgi:putative oxidoreductase